MLRMGSVARSVPRESLATAQGSIATLSGLVNAGATLATGFVFTEFPLPGSSTYYGGITAGPGRTLWIVEPVTPAAYLPA